MALALDNAQLEKNSLERLNAIIKDLNDGVIPISRYHELLNENFFENGEAFGLPIQSKTFIAYAIKKLKDPNAFLNELKKQLGDSFFNDYMKLPNYLVVKGELRTFTAYELYLQDKGQGYNLEKLPTNIMNILYNHTVSAVAPTEAVDAHNTSAHKSADESHVLAFKAMLHSNNIDVVLNYEAPRIQSKKVTYTSIDDLAILAYKLKAVNTNFQITANYKNGMEDEFIVIRDVTALENFITTYRTNDEIGGLNVEFDAPESSRKVTVTRNDVLTNFVNEQLIELQNKVNALVAMNDEEINNVYLQDNTSSKEKIDGFRFQANAAKRYVDNMMQTRRCDGSSYAYSTNTVNTCGLTMEEMLATAYFSSKDETNFFPKVTANVSFVRLIKQLHDMRRGYNIDNGTDKPEINKFPKNLDTDRNRCAGGGVNSLSWALKACHKAYNPVAITQENIERELRAIYTKIIEDNHESIVKKATEKELGDWFVTNKITGDLRESLKAIFDATYEANFREEYTGCIPDESLNHKIANALNNMPVPQTSREFVEQQCFENFTEEKICNLIKNGNLGLMHLSQEHGYESTLNYLAKKRGDAFVSTIVQLILASEPKNIRALVFLSKSNLSDADKNKEVHKINSTSITLENMKTLNEYEVQCLLGSKTKAQLLKKCTDSKLINLFLLCATKLTFTDLELKTEYNLDFFYKSPPLHLSARNGNVEAVKNIIKSVSQAKKPGLLTAKNHENDTPLHVAALNGKVEVVNAILATRDVNKQELLLERGYNGNTPLHSAAGNGYASVVNAILATEGVNKNDLLNAKDDKGFTALQIAAWNGKLDVVNAILATAGVNKNDLLNAKNNNGDTALQIAAANGKVDVVNAILATEGVDKNEFLNAKSNNGDTALQIAAANGKIDVVNAILATEGVDKNELLNAKDDKGHTALQLAAAHGKVDVVNAILATAGVNKNDLLIAKSNIGGTALQLAAANGKIDVVNAILATEGVKKDDLLNAKNNNGDTALQIALKKSDLKIIEAILSHGAYPSIDILLSENTLPEDINNKLIDAYLKSPIKNEDDIQRLLVQAIEKQSIARVTYLIQNGAMNTLANLIKPQVPNINQSSLSSAAMPENPPANPEISDPNDVTEGNKRHAENELANRKKINRFNEPD